MGLLTQGTSMDWDEIKEWCEHIKKHGILQFIHQYNKLKDRTNDSLKWGDEIEYSMAYLDHENKSARLFLKASEVLPKLQEAEENDPENAVSSYRVEFTDYMVEGSPAKPYGGCMRHFNVVEANMRYRRQEIYKILEQYKATMVLFTAFPRIGCPGFTEPKLEPHPDTNPVSKSIYWPDRALCQNHPRYSNLAKTPRERREKKTVANIPIFVDKNTKLPHVNDLPNDVNGESAKAALDNHVYMDTVCFGFGCCCLQVTFQGCNIDESRSLYDQLAVFAPIMLALSAATPVYRGVLTDYDCRWPTLVNVIDDRTEEELGNEPLKKNKYVIPKSRYDSVDMYLSKSAAKYNDLPILYDEEHLKMLLDAGIDKQLAQHIAHLFIRDPVSCYKELLNMNDEEETDHFENIQSTNWQTVRFKPPPVNSPIGWRVEFRPMEIQMTDFENAAYVVFVVLITRVILSFKLDLLMPVSMIDKNMEAASKRRAVLDGLFYFKKEMQRGMETKSTDQESDSSDDSDSDNEIDSDQYELMDIDTIINGKDGGFIGLIPLVNYYLDNVDIDIDTRCTISQYLRLISGRASGKLMTTAEWIRSFVQSHPKYKQDSIVTEEINYDLTCLADKVSRSEMGCPELFAVPESKTSNVVPDRCRRMQDEVDAFNQTLSAKQLKFMRC